ncbi:PREDICTED: gibberellin 3-beta-dioxygenase 3 [Tarenaya hassleriana]|uniref:gibberellin 3-beta-dioxygenase 3 n=1 Tax=Tarenaya hassleriana TaxID=28532 RepID=UPI00053C4917|nr:PREDICTED: gibberellin 3-beta-dioxygenase 3 [Tarenaya hassleriana]
MLHTYIYIYIYMLRVTTHFTIKTPETEKEEKNQRMMSSPSNSITQLFKNKPVKHDHIIPLDFTSVKTLPDSHVWSAPSPLPEPEALSIPVLDMNHAVRPSLLRQACEEWGVFQVINHGVSEKLLLNVEYQTRRLFSLPMQRKILAVRSPDESTGYGLARISMFYDKFMWSEGFSVMGSSSVRHAKLLWPNDHKIFSDVMEEYQKAMETLGRRLICMLMDSLGLAQEDVGWTVPDRTGSRPEIQPFLQLNSYPVCPEPDLAMGLAPHTDSSLFTILHQANIPGLQIQRSERGGAWSTVDPIPGGLVVIMGDVFHMLSNGRFNNVMHRVVVNSTRHRVSAAYFYGPPRSVTVGPSSKLIDEDRPRMYRDVSWGEYLETKATYFDKALALFRLC